MSGHTTQRAFIVDGARPPFRRIQSGPPPITSVDLAVECGCLLLACRPFDRTVFDVVLPVCVKVLADCLSAVTTLGTSGRSTG